MPKFRKRTTIAVLVLLLLAVGGVVGILRSKVRGGPLSEQIASITRQAFRDGHLSGNVLVARGGEVLYEQGFGLADFAEKTPNGPETRFPLASVSKPFTAVLIMRLVESDQLSVGTKLASLFPQLADRPAGAITIHQLLTHTSGRDMTRSCG